MVLAAPRGRDHFSQCAPVQSRYANSPAKKVEDAMSACKLLIICVVIITVARIAPAQNESALPQPADNANAMPVQIVAALPPPLTKLEAFAARKNVVIVKRFTDVGVVQSDDGSAVRITAVEFADA